MNIVFVNYHDFHSNSAVHIFNLAEHLGRLGVSCAVCVPDRTETVVDLGPPSFCVLDFEGARRGLFGFDDGRGPDFIHAWTPREGVRKLTAELAATYSVPYLVHLEDNEDVITADALGILRDDLLTASDDEVTRHVTDHISHPRRAREFLDQAAGVTIIVDRLGEFVPSHVPALVLWPAFEEDLFFPQEASESLRRRLGISDGDHVVVYAGNVHPTNAGEVRSLYLAIALLNRRQLPVRLVRLGRDFVDFLQDEWKVVADHLVDVDFRPRSEVPSYYALADVFVQPGRADEFNDFRMPSKLPEFFAMGRPVILPPTNIGRIAKDGEECVLLERGDALDIATKLEALLHDRARRSRIAEGGRRFAEQHFSWARSASRLKDFYDTLARRLAVPRRGPALDDVAQRYSSFRPTTLSYATVRDYCDSADNLPFLAELNGDLKDVQRPWAFKAIVGSVPPRGTLLEIGAGEPTVADSLVKLGYDVTVVDPYDGRDRGPADVDRIRARYPRVRVVRGVFPDNVPPGERFDCVYSISVLEHVPLDQIHVVCEAARTIARCSTIHAIDHVHVGKGSEEHLEKLQHIVRCFGISEGQLDDVRDALDRDPDAYFLSAEGHNRWRGYTPYDDFPMRRCVSIHLCITQHDSVS